MDHTNWQRTRDILISTICIGIILWAAWNIGGRFVDIIVILLISMAIAFLLTPLVNMLVKYNVPRLVAAIVVFLVVVAVIGGIGSALVLSLIRQTQAFSSTIITYFEKIPNLSSFEGNNTKTGRYSSVNHQSGYRPTSWTGCDLCTTGGNERD